MNKDIVTWQSVFSLCNSLKDKIKRPDIIICIANGGIIPAAILSKLCRVYRTYNIGIKSYDQSNNQRLAQMYYEPSISHEDKSQRVLIIDDILDTGNTFKYVESYLHQRGFYDLTFASLHFKQLHQAEQYVPENFVYAQTCDETTWIVYPWED